MDMAWFHHMIDISWKRIDGKPFLLANYNKKLYMYYLPTNIKENGLEYNSKHGCSR